MTQNLSTPLSSQWVADAAASFLADPAARLAGNAVATTDVETVSLDRAVLTSIDSSVSDLIPDAAITDQKRSGRCWAFAGLNTLRAAMIKDLGLEGFSLSQNFIYFHDKLEKANAFLNRFTADMVAGRDLEDREVVADLASPPGTAPPGTPPPRTPPPRTPPSGSCGRPPWRTSTGSWRSTWGPRRAGSCGSTATRTRRSPGWGR